MSIISIKNVSKNYGQKKVLDSVSLEIEKGEIFGLLGSNGAGKSTITKIILGLEKPTSGNIVYYEGRQINIKEKLTLVPQDIAAYKNFSVEKNLEFFASISGLSGDLKKNKINFLLNWLNLNEFRKTKTSFLSGGYQRLLNIAISLISDPEIIFLDEPTVGLDPLMRKMFWDKIKELRNQGKTIILTTHYMDEAQNLCTKIALLKKGKLLTIGKPIDLIREYGGIKVTVLKLTSMILDDDLPKIRAAINNRNVIVRDKYLFVPVEQEHGFEKIVALTQWLISRGYSIDYSTTKEPDLEDVFLQLTGEKMKTDN
ncbi:MAG: ABC transporter ATP-binding protein [Candidatus ainarchaeum sp.]|nr:ABC transporter ATP-binding protein [Candidatus ainarchaeum sp.]